MERTPEHLIEDPTLRQEYISQLSWDEWALVNAPFFLLPDCEAMVTETMRSMGMDATYEDALAVAVDEWHATLDRATNVDEVLYLLGHDYIERLRIIDQQHAELLQRAVEIGLVPEREEDIDFRNQFGA